MAMDEPKVTLTVRLPAPLKRDLDAATEELGQTLTVFVERALREAIAKHQQSK